MPSHRRAASARRCVVTDGGRFVSNVIRRVHPPGPDGVLYMQEFGSVGSGLGAAIGAAIAQPNRLTALFTSDGGMLMALGDLDLPIRERIPVLVACMNDQALGSEIRLLGEAGLDVSDALLPTPDPADVARAMGARGCADRVCEWLASLDRPLVLDCRLLREDVGIEVAMTAVFRRQFGLTPGECRHHGSPGASLPSRSCGSER